MRAVYGHVMTGWEWELFRAQASDELNDTRCNKFTLTVAASPFIPL